MSCRVIALTDSIGDEARVMPSKSLTRLRRTFSIRVTRMVLDEATDLHGDTGCDTLDYTVLLVATLSHPLRRSYVEWLH